MANPYFTKSNVFAAPKRGTATPSAETLEASYNAPSATGFDTGRMSYEGTVVKTAGLLTALFATAAVTWLVAPQLFWVGLIVGFVLALIIIFRKKINPGLIVTYAIAEGVFLGGLSAILEDQEGMQGIALQALLATGITAAVCLWLYRSGRVRVTAGFSRVLMIGLISYGIFSLVNLGMMLFTDIGGWGMRSEVEIGGIPLGVFVGAIAVVLASMSLIMDFDGIKRGVEREVPAVYEWAAAFGLVVTLVWLYLEFIRILAILRGR
ncbi:MAG: Bax inhibitor-1/YccA family protein [Demequinaceae bacterium]|nr:Bax inhibitor-1/YccA family protein [Demequinaceae bacterium]